MEDGEKQEIPPIIKDVGFDFRWDNQKVWALDVSVTEMESNFAKASSDKIGE